MRRPPLSTLFALTWALIAAVSAPGLAVSHGAAHHELAEHLDHAHALDGVAAEHVELASPPEVESDEHHGTHAHLELAALLAKSRADFSAAVLTPVVEVPLARVALVSTAPITARSTVRDGPPSGSPRQPRAPPLG